MSQLVRLIAIYLWVVPVWVMLSSAFCMYIGYELLDTFEDIQKLRREL